MFLFYHKRVKMTLDFVIWHAIRNPAKEEEENVEDIREDKNSTGKWKAKDEHGKYGRPNNEREA